MQSFNPQIIAYLEELEDLRQPAAFRILGANGGLMQLSGTVSGLQPSGEAPGFWLNNSLRISLQHLVQVDGLLAAPLT